MGLAAKGAVRALKGTKAWGLVVKAASREEAAGALRRMGASPQQAEHALQAVEQSGENVRWKGRIGATGRGTTRPELPKPQSAVQSAAIDARMSERKGLQTTWSTPTEGLKPGRKPLTAPKNVKWDPVQMSEDVAGTNTPDGNIQLNREFDRKSTNPNEIWEIIRALRHEWFHRILTPKAGVPEADLQGWSLFMRQLRNDLYYDNQFGKFAEETAAEAYGSGSLRKGFEYLSPKNPSGKKRMDSYRLTPQGIKKDALKLGLGAGVGMGAALESAHLTGQHYADLLKDHQDNAEESDGNQAPSPRRLPQVKHTRRKTSR